MTNPMPPPRSPNLVPHKITKGEIYITHAPPSSPVHADNVPVVNLFCNLREVTQNKRQLIPRDKSDHTPTRKKHGRMTCCASSVKAQGVIQELLVAELSSLHVDDLFDGVTKSLNVHRTIVTPHCKDADDGINKSDNNTYHPLSVAPPPLLHICLCKSIRRRSS